MKSEIPYSFIDEAIRYYKLRSFKYLEVPWVVPEGILNMTLPCSARIIKNHQMVGSGEQSFLYMKTMGRLPEGKYVCATPCYRPGDSGRSNNHCTQFYKVELINLAGENKPDEAEYDFLIKTAFGFMSRYRSDIEVVDIEDGERKNCRTILSHDIQTIDGLELGSYGIRHSEKIGYWIYGTGVAVPRFEKQPELTL